MLCYNKSTEEFENAFTDASDSAGRDSLMTWEEYRNKLRYWDNDKKIKMLSQIDNFPDADRVFKTVQEKFSYFDAPIEQFVNVAVDKGVRFTPEQIIELEPELDVKTVSRLVSTSSVAFTEEELSSIDYAIDSVTYNKALAKARGRSSKESGFFASLFGSSSASKKTQNSSRGRRCNGDCAHCPPHYGYRYGRWYYGHHHTHGCEFHGNKEGDLSD